MSALEEIAKKYLDELSGFIPLSCTVSFVAGVSLVSAHGMAGDSLWLSLLTSNYSRYWYFRDIIVQLQMWKLVVIFAFSLSGPLVSKSLSKKIVLIGVRTVDERLKALYKRALDVASRAEFSKIELDAAKQWRVMRFAVVWSHFKLSSLFFSLAGVSLFLFCITHSIIDAIPIAIFTSAGIWMSFLFSRKYFVSYLPERILFDASIGLADPRVIEDIAG
jgi:hypothetical protein